MDDDDKKEKYYKIEIVNPNADGIAEYVAWLMAAQAWDELDAEAEKEEKWN